MLGNMEKKRLMTELPGPTAQKENVRTWSSRWERDRKADGGQGSRPTTSSILSMTTQPMGVMEQLGKLSQA
jgi:hypothetical protein